MGTWHPDQRADVDMVIIDAAIVKRDHQLVGVDLAKARKAIDATIDSSVRRWGRRNGTQECIRRCRRMTRCWTTRTPTPTIDPPPRCEARESIFGEPASG